MHWPPGFFHVLQRDFDNLVHHCLLNAREFAAFNLGLGASAAKHVFHQGKYQTRINNHDGIAAQGIHFENIDGGWHRQRAHELAELGHINGYGVQLHALAHRV